jgi:hypothetical protein
MPLTGLVGCLKRKSNHRLSLIRNSRTRIPSLQVRETDVVCVEDVVEVDVIIEGIAILVIFITVGENTLL